MFDLFQLQASRLKASFSEILNHPNATYYAVQLEQTQMCIILGLILYVASALASSNHRVDSAPIAILANRLLIVVYLVVVMGDVLETIHQKGANLTALTQKYKVQACRLLRYTSNFS